MIAELCIKPDGQIAVTLELPPKVHEALDRLRILEGHDTIEQTILAALQAYGESDV